MTRLYRPFEAKADPRRQPYPVMRFNVLATDHDRIKDPSGPVSNWPWATASHPDVEGRMAMNRNDDASGVWTFYESYSNPSRGLIETTQSIFEDGAVQRYTNVGVFDDRMAYVPMWGNDPPRPGGTQPLYEETIAFQIPKSQ